RADLSRADLSDANLSDADLSGANLSGAKGLRIAADALQRLQAVATAALLPGALTMETWHQCETTHCIAGWAIHQAGEPGRLLQSLLGPEVAGLMLLGPEAHSHFFDSANEATEYLLSVLQEPAAS
ncbi:MAG: pentapeptide repeat-containing protein, partial [Steroidobacteraceae bacterium]